MKTRWTKASNDTLIAEDEETREWLAKRPRDALIQAETKELRNPGHHRKFFALVNLVFENAPESVVTNYQTTELFLAALKISVGHCDVVWARSPQHRNQYVPCHIPKSISFAKMDQHEFEQFYDRCCDVIIRDFWPDMDKATLKAEVAEMCGAGGLSEIGRMPTGHSSP